MSQDRFTFLLTRKLSGEITPPEQLELDDLLGNEALRKQYNLLSRYWDSRPAAGQPDIEKALSAVLKNISTNSAATELKLSPNKTRPWKRVLVPVALIIAVAGYFFTQKSDNALAKVDHDSITPGKAKEFVEKQNLKGTRSLITLADGTQVWLNADSRLTYPPAFNSSTREVTLTGEAFFDVAKNKLKPFIIHMENGTVKVLGTSFNIKAYPGDRIIETSVVTGRVAFIPANIKSPGLSDTTFLTPDLKAVYTIATGIVNTIPTVGKEDKAWTEGKLIFRNETLQEVSVTLERSFGKEVIFDKDELMNFRVTGSFENNTLEEILYYLSHIKPFTYRVTETQVLIYGL